MPSIDVLAVNLCIQLLLILLETSKSLVAVRNVKTTIQSSLQQVQFRKCYEPKRVRYD
jgi:hypothetical protein